MIKPADLLKGDIPPWVRRFIKKAGKGINRYRMFGEGEHVLIGVSGGKDSLALSLALAVRLRWLPIDYRLSALHIDWKEYPLPPEKMDELRGFFDTLGIEFTSIQAQMFSSSFKDEFNCYLCSRNRRRILFEYAREHDISTIAMGHHLDDIVETTMINLFFRGEFSSMKPVQDFFSGKIYVVRPLCEVRESAVEKIAKEIELPLTKAPCPYDKTNIRSRLKPIVRELSHLDKYAREHVYHALNFSEEVKSGVFDSTKDNDID
ncbi:MAG: tRNA 2-thiocytidine biosynthesis TtcA family protein [Spirochaetia bacterium]